MLTNHNQSFGSINAFNWQTNKITSFLFIINIWMSILVGLRTITIKDYGAENDKYRLKVKYLKRLQAALICF